MRLTSLLLVFARCAWALPGILEQTTFSSFTTDLISDSVKQSIINEPFSIASLSTYSLRVFNPDPSLCDPTVKQHAGFLDIADGKHLFFWFFESRTAPTKAPLTLWLNGGAGASSTLGMLFELGPCNIANGGKNTTFNPHSWNRYSNIIFLDQPVNVGFSYSTDNSTINNSPDAAEDVWAFLQLFLAKYPQYSSVPFHLAAESYGGTYGPHIGSTIHAKNKELVLTAASDASTSLKNINLASIMLVNGHTDAKVQFASVPNYVCNGPYAVIDPAGPECTAWKEKVPTCERLVQTCYDFDTPLTCIPADLYCWGGMYDPILLVIKRNPYDIRQRCDEPGFGCYPEIEWISTWLNDATTKSAIGLDPSLNFEGMNWDVNGAFHAQGDSIHNSALLLPALIEDGIRVLVLAGMADIMCNFMGNEAWVEKLDNIYHDEFAESEFLPWITLQSHTQAGEVRYAGGGGSTAGNLTFVKMYEAGHMAAHDQPEASLDLFTRWIFDSPLYFPNPEPVSLGGFLDV